MEIIMLLGCTRRHKHYANASLCYILHTLSVCLYLKGNISSFAPADVHKTSRNIEQLYFQRVIANLSDYLPTLPDGQFRLSDTVTCSVTSI